MNLSATLLFYLTIGLGVSVAVLTGEQRPGAARRAFMLLTALLFWPLYVPLLLSATPSASPSANARHAPPAEPAASDGMAAAIVEVERELAAAFASLDGWAEDVLDHERDRLRELGAALAAQASRIRDMDALAESTRAAGDELPLAAANAVVSEHGEHSERDETLDRIRQSRQARANNLARLAEVRRGAYADLMATLAWIRELVSMIHLAKFTGAPAARAEELVAQIAAAVEGISAATWREEAVA